jgi:hypothetical protein
MKNSFLVAAFILFGFGAGYFAHRPDIAGYIAHEPGGLRETLRSGARASEDVLVFCPADETAVVRYRLDRGETAELIREALEDNL